MELLGQKVIMYHILRQPLCCLKLTPVLIPPGIKNGVGFVFFFLMFLNGWENQKENDILQHVKIRQTSNFSGH